MAAVGNRDAPSSAAPAAAKRGCHSERMWIDVRRAARIAREEGVKLRVRRDGVDVIGVLKQHSKMPRRVVNKEQKKQTDTVEPTLPSTAVDEASPPSPSKRKERSAQRLLAFQQKKRAAIFAAKYCRGCSDPNTIARHEKYFQKYGWHVALAGAKLRWLLWRAWAQYRPIFGGPALQYTSLREQHVYRRAAKLYEAAFKLDPGKSGRTLAAWLRRATPMESETASVDGSVGSQPPKRAKKSHGSRVQAPPVA